ncbi:hypothetical protein sos41_03520 [Alphaproteobacteria bacterium SO-S41]|nr:hypothetical protein sos41_03520 [Alphaproteobacteria bacterium SO-S41]
MTKTNRLRAGLLATAAGAGLIALAGSAAALEYTVGGMKITFDTTISMGGSLRVADRNNAFLPEANGGNRDPRSGTGGAVLSAPAAGGFGLQAPTNLLGQALPARVTITNNADNFDGSINTDDGRLNFDNGDFIGASAKVNHDFLLEYDNFQVFSRFYYFYDAVLDDESIGRSGLSDRARDQVGKSVELLDLYLSGNFNLGDLPLNVRVGKQVVSWGEGTFILNGINAINPIDVAAFRRPGAEIKEGLLPVPMAYMSLGLPANLSVEAFYQFKFEPYSIDASGSPFSGADIVARFNENGLGNLGGRSYTSGSLLGGTRRNCAGDSDPAGNSITDGSGDTSVAGTLNNNGLSGAVNLGLLPAPNCLAGASLDFLTPNTLGMAERDRNLRGDADIVARGEDINPENSGQFGIALRWYAEELGATEFSLYYMNYHSRLPFLEITSGAPKLGISTTSVNANITPDKLAAGAAGVQGALAARFAPAAGCVSVTADPFTFADPRYAGFREQAIADPRNLINAQSIGTVRAIYASSIASTLVSTAGSPFFGLAANNPAVVAAASAQAASVVGVANSAGNIDTYANAMQINCALALAQSKLVDTSGNGAIGAGDLPMLVNGSETINVESDSRLDVIYPENIELFGFSFNTTIGGWGVQAEVSYRPRAPFQTDTDAQTVEAAAAACSFPVAVADFGFLQFEPLNYNGVTNCNPGAINNLDGNGRYRTTGVIRNEMFTFQLGTTATFTSSDPIVEFLGADLGILLTEFGAVYVPGVEDTYLTNSDGSATAIARSTLQYQNTGCQGSDLPLGGLLGLDFKPSDQCRPTDFSFGYVLLARVDYNNAFGSGWAVSPQIAFSHDVSGATPAPYGNYIEDRMSVNLSVSGTLDNKYRVGASYTNFFGGGILNKASDQDFASLTFSYSF